LDDLSRKTNESKIVDALATVFVRPHLGMEEVAVRFATSTPKGFPEWATSFKPDEKCILVSPVGVYRFSQECDKSAVTLRTPQARRNFQSYRFRAYLAEIRKLPPQNLLFLQVLKEVANACQITQAEKKGGGVEEADDQSYMTLLWAFKELETFFAESNGVNLRSEYGIRWYESDWILGKK
jgi:hypothetical protein